MFSSVKCRIIVSNKNPSAHPSHDSDKGDDHTSHSCILSAVGQRLASSCLKHRTQRIHRTGRRMGEMSQQVEDYRFGPCTFTKRTLLSLDRSSLDPNPGLQQRLEGVSWFAYPSTHIYTHAYLCTHRPSTHIYTSHLYTHWLLCLTRPLWVLASGNTREVAWDSYGLGFISALPNACTPSMTENSLPPVAIPSIPEIELFQGPVPEAVWQSWVH